MEVEEAPIQNPQTALRKTQRAIKRISPPVFKGEPGERPEAHLLCTLDCFDAIGILTDRAKLWNF